jgi:hypothetical protein
LRGLGCSASSPRAAYLVGGLWLMEPVGNDVSLILHGISRVDDGDAVK